MLVVGGGGDVVWTLRRGLFFMASQGKLALFAIFGLAFGTLAG